MAADIPHLQQDLSRLGKARLSSAVGDVDKIIDILVSARDQIAQSLDTHTASLTLARLQNPVREAFEKVNDDLSKTDKVRKALGKSLDRHFPLRPLPTDHDPMANHTELINRAIAMHLMREGQFSVASTFVQEALKKKPLGDGHDGHGGHDLSKSATPAAGDSQDDTDMDDDGEEEEIEEEEIEEEEEDDDDTDNDTEHITHFHSSDPSQVLAQSQELQARFATMYEILTELKVHNLLPAISWASTNSAELEARGSNLEFELCKRQYIWLLRGPATNGLPDDGRNGLAGALQYARRHFPRFSPRHAREIAQLSAALAYEPNVAESPYARLLCMGPAAFAEVAASFTREFCSLLGLSAESPLYVAATAGAIALPQLIKYVERVAQARTEWTTSQELAFETPLPESMIYHSIFVCPVSKEQTTDANPPMMLPCGHVLARESMQNLTKQATRIKCPYCPVEGNIKDARQIIL